MAKDASPSVAGLHCHSLSEVDADLLEDADDHVPMLILLHPCAEGGHLAQKLPAPATAASSCATGH
jgi:hypothetical protein